MVLFQGGREEHALPPLFLGRRSKYEGRVSPRSKRLGLQARYMLVFQDASGLISRYHWERTKPLHTRVVRLLEVSFYEVVLEKRG
jgi:hypothetical protein